jgi:hypothetical protein
MKHFLHSFLGISKENPVRRDILFGARRFSNYLFRRGLLMGGLRFFVTGFSSWRQKNLLPFIDTTEVKFLPQGVVICFYGVLAIRLGLYLFLRRFWAVGRGFNEYDKERKQIRLFRWGFPGKNRRIEFFYPFFELEALRLERQSYLKNFSNSGLYLLLKNKRKVLLTQLDSADIQSSQEREYFAAELARFLQIPLEGDFESLSKF